FVVMLAVLLPLIFVPGHALMAKKNTSSGTASLIERALKSPSPSTQESNDVKQMNEFVDAGNKSVEEANKQTAVAGKKLAALFGEENLKDFPENRASLKPKVDEVVALLDKSIANLKDAAEQFESASKLKLDDNLKDYYTTKAQSFRKLADLNELSK